MSKNAQYNVLWICTDQQRWDTLGCYGNPYVHTPNLDRLAQNGTRFERAYCQNPTCSPSRASFLTGRYPRTTRCRQNGQRIPRDEKLISKIFSEQGYVCGLSGKLHLNPCNPDICKGMEERIDDGYDVFHWSHGGHDGWATHEYFQWLREKGQRFSACNVEGTELVQYGMNEEYHQTTWCTEKALNFIEANVEYKNPWFFSLNIYDPHHPFDPPKAYLDRYMDCLDDLPLPNYAPGELDDKPLFQKLDHKGAYNNHDSNNAAIIYDNMSDWEHRLMKASYYAMVDLIDKQVGRLIDTLERLGQLENTIVIFTSDHGEMLGDHGIYLKGPYFYEGATHIPLIISCPGTIRQGFSSSALVELVDLSPTLTEAIGLDTQPQMQGKSLWDLLTDPNCEDRHKNCIYCEYYNSMPWHKAPNAQCTMVFDGRYKLVNVHSTKEGELYDLSKDPKETHNLWDDPDYTSVKISKLVQLSDAMAFTVDPMGERLSAW
ncbi:sulfatase family protein [Marasmitruncus massiliensis]|uniref:sulfatase family protein n=1 Tax=Marasmitruncus massiliensis TaxID=1944642 RepID=UPI000C7CF0CB|nr:sulfatase-like hydrolase/transferase [Marasmitruncus massiliensis]